MKQPCYHLQIYLLSALNWGIIILWWQNSLEQKENSAFLRDTGEQVI